MVRFLAGLRYFPVPQSVQTVSWGHTVSYPVDTEASSFNSKAAGASS